MSEQIPAFDGVEPVRRAKKQKATSLRLPVALAEQVSLYLKLSDFGSFNDLVLTALSEHLAAKTRPVYVPNKLYTRIEAHARMRKVSPQEWAVSALDDALHAAALKKAQS